MNDALSPPTDPVERVIFEALSDAGEDFVFGRDGGINGPTKGLDFYLPSKDLYIEVKRYHALRVVSQMARVENVIVCQGLPAAEYLAGLIRSAPA